MKGLRGNGWGGGGLIEMGVLFNLEKTTVSAGLKIATDTVANATNIFSLATKNSSLVAKVTSDQISL